MKITLEFDTKDLSVYHETGDGHGTQNILGTLRDRLLNGTLEARFQFIMAHKGEDGPQYHATISAYKEEEALIRRMLDGMKIG